MNDLTHNYSRQEALILNSTYFDRSDSFYFELFRIPEVLNRLKQYKEILNENDFSIPFWVYNLTENFKIHTEGGKQRLLTHFLTSLGLFDRYIVKKGWPKYIIGKDPLISVILGETSFEEQALLLTQSDCKESQGFQFYEISSYYNARTDLFHLTQLKRRAVDSDMDSILTCMKSQDFSLENSFQLLTPHTELFMDELKSKGVFAKDFLELDSSLKWLWPIWKRNQIKHLKEHSKNRLNTRHLI